MKEYFEKIENEQAEKFYKKIRSSIIKENKMFIITANPETIMIAEKDQEFKNIILNEKTTVVADGIGIIKGAKMLNIPLEHRVLGIELAVKTLEYCNELKKSMYLFGAKEEVIQKLKVKIKDDYPNVKLLGSVNGYVENKDKIFEEIEKKSPDVILIALGIPAQEKIIFKHYDKFSKGIFIGVGGSFDVISGTKKRAPKLFLKLNLEWLYRIITEPKRLKRFFNSNVKYIAKIKKERKNNR